MKTFKKLILSLAVLIGISSCNTLDFDPTDRYSESVAWSSKENVAKYMASLYPVMRIYSEFGDRAFGTAAFSTDGLTYMLKYSSNTAGYGTPNLVVFSETQITPSQNVVSFWSDCYTRVRKVNEFLDGIGSCSVLTDEEKNSYVGEARFLRGYLYYLLVRAHKNVILYDYLGDWQNFHKANSTEAEGWEFVYQDLEFAYQNLEKDRRTDGRVDKATAAALMSRAMLFAERWDDVITACKRVQDLGFDLDPNYANVFKAKAGNRSVETIFQIDYLGETYSHTYDSKNCPSGDDPNSTAWCPAPTQEMVNLYETKDGKKVDWFNLPASTDLKATYESLEPRFHASVLYNGATWKGRTIETFIGGKDGYKAYDDEGAPKTTVTGYYLRKNLDETNTDIVVGKSTQSIASFRYAEVLLNYAEALCKSSSQKNNAAAMGYVNAVRNRVGLPNVSGSSDDAVMAAIKQERAVELAFEGFHWWDLKRWKQAKQELNNTQFHGIKIGVSGTFEFESCDGKNTRVFPDKYYSLPIPTGETTVNILCQQLDEWK